MRATEKKNTNINWLNLDADVSYSFLPIQPISHPRHTSSFSLPNTKPIVCSTTHTARGDMCNYNKSRRIVSWLVPAFSTQPKQKLINFVRKREKASSCSKLLTWLSIIRHRERERDSEIRHDQRKRGLCLHRQACWASWTLRRFNLSCFLLSDNFLLF